MRRVWGANAACCALPLLVSCAALQPVPDAPAQRFFTRGAASQQGDGTGTSRSGANPATQPCRDSATEWQNNANCFYGGLGVTMDNVEAYADSLTGAARENINWTARFNAALPLGGAIFLYKRIHDGASLLAPAALAAGVYGSLNAGIPDIHKHYLRTAHDLQCAALRQSRWLYRNDEIVGEPGPLAVTQSTRIVDEKKGRAQTSRSNYLVAPVDPAGRIRNDAVPLESLIRQLRMSLDEYTAVRDETLSRLEAPAQGATGGAFERARGSGNGAGKKDSRSLITEFTQSREDLAQAMLEKLELLRGQIRDASFVLYQEARAIDRDIVSTLGDAQPRFQDPQAVAKDVNARVTALAQSGEEAVPSRMTATMPPAFYDGVRSAVRLRQFSNEEGVRLYNAWLAARRFVQAQSAREERVRSDLLLVGCGESLVSTPRVPGTATSPNGSNGTGAPTTGTGTVGTGGTSSSQQLPQR